MENYLIYVALGISVFTACLHLGPGSLEFAKPLWANKRIPLSPRATLWMVWHMVSAVLFVVPALIGLGLWQGSTDFLWSALLLNTAVGLAAFMSNIVLRVGLRVLFQGLLFLPVSLALLLALI
ncbi:MAG: hypothetical protein ACPGRD_01700 [Planktomarina sp.]